MNTKEVIYKEVKKDSFICYFCDLQKNKEAGYIGFEDQYIVKPLMCIDCKNKMEKK